MSLADDLRKQAVYLAPLGSLSGDTRWEAAQLMRKAANSLDALPTSVALTAEEMREPPRASTIHSALSEANLEYSALSVGGANLFGSRESIDAAREWRHSHGQIDGLKTNLRHWRDECGKLHARILTSAEEMRERCAAEVESRNFPTVGDARRIATAIRSLPLTKAEEPASNG